MVQSNNNTERAYETEYLFYMQALNKVSKFMSIVIYILYLLARLCGKNLIFQSKTYLPFVRTKLWPHDTQSLTNTLIVITV